MENLSRKQIHLLQPKPEKKLVYLFVFVCSAFLFLQPTNAQNRDVPYVPTPEYVVDRMLEMADVGPGDYVIDLGSGDGRIVVAAALRGAVGHGVDIDPTRINEANENARNSDVEDRVAFIQGNIFETDFSRANVITMYLLSSVNMKLRQSLLDNLAPGSRVVSHAFDMNDWEPDEHVSESGRNVYLWIIPAQVEGEWRWNVDGGNFTMEVSQEFQNIEAIISRGNTTLQTQESVLSGERITVRARERSSGNLYNFTGKVEGDSIEGVVQIIDDENSRIEDWNATMN